MQKGVGLFPSMCRTFFSVIVNLNAFLPLTCLRFIILSANIWPVYESVEPETAPNAPRPRSRKTRNSVGRGVDESNEYASSSFSSFACFHHYFTQFLPAVPSFLLLAHSHSFFLSLSLSLSLSLPPPTPSR